MSTGIHHHVLRSVSLSIHPCICPSLSSSSHPSIYLAIHECIWAWTLLAIFRSSDLCVHVPSCGPKRHVYLSIYRSLSLYIYIIIYIHIYIYISLSICLSICECLYPSISLFVLVSNYLSLCLCIYLSISPSISLAISLTIYLSVCLSIYLFLYLSVCPSICVSSYLSVYLSICLSISLSIYLSVCLSIYLFLYLSVCPSICVSIYLSNYLSIYRYNIRTSKSGANMWCFVHFDFEMFFAPQRRALFQHPNLQKWREHVVFCTFWLRNVLRATTACTFSTSEPPKVARTCGVLCILTSKCASRHNGVHFFDISTSKSGPSMVCFVHFDLEMCFAPQRRALFRHLNFQRWSEPGVFCAFWLGNVLRATTACTFSTSQLPKVVRAWCVLYILTWKCASHHNGVHYFDISTSKSGPNLVCFVHFDFKMCFAPQRRAIFHFSSGQLAPHPPL